MRGLFLAKPEADAANVTAALEELSDFWSDTDKTAGLECSFELWCVGRHDDMFAGANEVASEAFGAFVVIDDDFVEVGEGFDFLIALFVEGAWTVGDGVLVDDRNGEVEVVPETVGVVGDGVDMLGAVRVELRLGMNLD